METALESRLSVAGNAISIIEQMNAGEKTRFITMCNQQRQQLYSLISWEFRYVSFLLSHFQNFDPKYIFIELSYDILYLS